MTPMKGRVNPRMRNVLVQYCLFVIPVWLSIMRISYLLILIGYGYLMECSQYQSSAYTYVGLLLSFLDIIWVSILRIACFLTCMIMGI